MSHSKYPESKTWKFYAVHRVGVFDDFDQCQAATKKNDLGYSNKFKGFESFENACVFVNIKDAAEAVRYGSGNCGVKTVTKDKSKGKKKATVASTPPSTKGALFVAPQTPSSTTRWRSTKAKRPATSFGATARRHSLRPLEYQTPPELRETEDLQPHRVSVNYSEEVIG